jgi:hypothetical protein
MFTLTKHTQDVDMDGQAGDVAPASQDGEHDVGPDDYLDYDPEPYERELLAAWAKAGVRPWKPTAEELDDACVRLVSWLSVSTTSQPANGPALASNVIAQSASSSVPSGMLDFCRLSGVEGYFHCGGYAARNDRNKRLMFIKNVHVMDRAKSRIAPPSKA